MDTGPHATHKKWPVKRIILFSFIVLLSLTGIYIYRNFNRILSDALLNSFNSSVISDVYELKFENLRVNFFEGNIRVFNVSVLPREKPLNDYPYINSSFSLKTENLLLESVEIRTLLKENRLVLHKILIAKPEIEFQLHGTRHILLPFKDTTAVANAKKDAPKRAIQSFGLKEFQLTEGAFHSINSNKMREFKIKDLTLTVHDLMLHENLSSYLASFNEVTLSIGKSDGKLKNGPVKHLGFENFNLGIDSLHVNLSVDTLTYQFQNFQTNLSDLDIQTKDSLFHIAMKSFDLSYRDKSIVLKEVSFKPNVSHAVIQNKFQFQHTEVSGRIGKLIFKTVNFDSLIYREKLFVEEIELENSKAVLFKDKTKPMDSTRFPVYLGQTIRAIKMPLLIKKIKATNVELDNTERKPDSTLANVKITKAKLEVYNLTNLYPNEKLEMYADAYINGKVRFTTRLAFSYVKPQFSFDGTLDKFDLTNLNELIQAYTPAKINKGISDEISFSGLAENTNSTGTMKFLYHDLEVDLELEDKAKWKSAIIAFTANTVLHDQNPISPDSPPRKVRFQIERDMNKGFVNVIIKSVLNGLKETMIMSKENRKNYHDDKRKLKEENKKDP